MAGIRSAMRSPMRSPMARAMGDAYVSLAQQALAILRRYGTDAHVYLPGADGIAVSGLLTNNYTDSNGSTGYSSVDGVAGLVLDGMGSVGAELVTNGDNESTVFALGTVFEANVTLAQVASVGGRSGFAAKATSNTSSSVSHQANCGYAMGAGKAYAISVDMYVPTGGVANCRFFDNDDGSYFSKNMTTKDAWVTVTEIRQPKATDWHLGFGNNTVDTIASGSPAFYLDNISVREITGIHATQATTANKPAERRGLYNLALSSQNLVNAAWVPVGDTTVASNRATFPTGGIGNPVRHNFSFTSGVPYTVALDCKTISGISTGTLDLQNGEIGTFTAPASRGIVVYNVTPGAARTWLDIQLDGAGVIDVYAVGIFAGTLTASQILAEGGIPLTTSTAASGVGKGWFGLDGGDSLALGAPVAQMVDDSFCIVCVNAGETGADKYIANIGCGASTQLITSVCIKSTGYAQAAWVDDGAAHIKTVVDAVNHHYTPTVVTAVKRGGLGYLRVNGVQVGSAVDLTVMGATTVSNGVIGGFNVANLSNQFSGAMGQPIMGKGAITDSDLLTLERIAAANFPNGPSF